MKKNVIIGILSVIFTIVILCGVVAGVPHIVDWMDEELVQQEYREEILQEYPIENIDTNAINNVVSGNIVNGVSDNSVSSSSDNGISGNDRSTVPPNNFVEVDDSYFSDALFIGDSRTVGLREYSTVSQADYYAATGLTVYKAFESRFVTLDGSDDKLTIEEALNRRRYGKIYIMLGINELGTGTADSFIDKYKQIIDRIRELQPEAVIFIQGIMKVTKEYSELSDYIHNEDIDERNERLALLADGQQVIYLDINPLLCNENGDLHEEYTSDGVHLKAEYMSVWVDFLKKYGIIL